MAFVFVGIGPGAFLGAHQYMRDPQTFLFVQALLYARQDLTIQVVDIPPVLSATDFHPRGMRQQNESNPYSMIAQECHSKKMTLLCRSQRFWWTTLGHSTLLIAL